MKKDTILLVVYTLSSKLQEGELHYTLHVHYLVRLIVHMYMYQLHVHVVPTCIIFFHFCFQQPIFTSWAGPGRYEKLCVYKFEKVRRINEVSIV